MKHILSVFRRYAHRGVDRCSYLDEHAERLVMPSDVLGAP